MEKDRGEMKLAKGGIVEQIPKFTEEYEKIIKNLKLEKYILENEIIKINKRIGEIDIQLYNYNKKICTNNSNGSFSNSMLNNIKNNIVHNQ